MQKYFLFVEGQLREIIKVDYYISKISRCIKQARDNSEFALFPWE